MKAIQLERPEAFRVIDVPEPPAPGPGDAVVRVHRVGICGTDFSGYLGKMPFFSYPRIPGHELGVEVVAVGPGVTHVKVGDRCSIEPYINCQKCYSCIRGHTNCCMHHQTLGVHIDGGLQRLFTIPARKLHISTKLTFDQLALVETLAIGCHAIDRANPKATETVVVIGAGPIGLSAIMFAKLSGAKTIVIDVNEQRLAFVHDRMGVKHTVTADGTELKQIEDLTHGNWADVVVDATGNNKSMVNAMNYVAFAGKLVFVGITSQEIVFTQPLMHRREMSFLASRNAVSADFARIIQLIEAGHIDTKPWITHHAGFAEMIELFPTWMKPESRVIKAVVEID